MARGTKVFQQDMEGSAREVLPEEPGPPGYQLQTDRHSCYEVESPVRRGGVNLR